MINSLLSNYFSIDIVLVLLAYDSSGNSLRLFFKIVQRLFILIFLHVKKCPYSFKQIMAFCSNSAMMLK